MWVAPMRAVLEEQQELIDAVSSWAEEQRKLADRFSELADRHRKLTEGVMSTLTPTLDHLDRLASRTSTKQAGKPSKATSSGRQRPANAQHADRRLPVQRGSPKTELVANQQL